MNKTTTLWKVTGSDRIEPVQSTKQTEHTVWFLDTRFKFGEEEIFEKRERKKTENYQYFNSFEEAKFYLLERLNKKLKNLHDEIAFTEALMDKYKTISKNQNEKE